MPNFARCTLKRKISFMSVWVCDPKYMQNPYIHVINLLHLQLEVSLVCIKNSKCRHQWQTEKRKKGKKQKERKWKQRLWTKIGCWKKKENNIDIFSEVELILPEKSTFRALFWKSKSYRKLFKGLNWIKSWIIIYIFFIIYCKNILKKKIKKR